MRKTLTTCQFSALGDLRRFGRLYPAPSWGCDRGTVFGFSRRTLQALVDLGYARWETIRDTSRAGTSIMSGVVLIGTPGDTATCQSCGELVRVAESGRWFHPGTGLIGWADDPADGAHRALPA